MRVRLHHSRQGIAYCIIENPTETLLFATSFTLIRFLAAIFVQRNGKMSLVIVRAKFIWVDPLLNKVTACLFETKLYKLITDSPAYHAGQVQGLCNIWAYLWHCSLLGKRGGRALCRRVGDSCRWPVHGLARRRHRHGATEQGVDEQCWVQVRWSHGAVGESWTISFFFLFWGCQKKSLFFGNVHGCWEPKDEIFIDGRLKMTKLQRQEKHGCFFFDFS